VRNALEQENIASLGTSFRSLSIPDCMTKDVDAGGAAREKPNSGVERFLRNIMAVPFLLGVASFKLRAHANGGARRIN
jgi:hypothetical protein